MDFWRATPSFSVRFKSRRRMAPSRPTTVGQPKQVSENGSYEETGRTRISSFRIQLRMPATQVAMP